MSTIEETSHTTQQHESRFFGQVKWFDKSKGYGFVTDLDTKQDYFVHHSALKEQNAEEYAYLVAGEYIEFELSEKADQGAVDSQGRKLAVNVTGIRGGPLMYKVIKANQPVEGEGFRRVGEEKRTFVQRDNTRGRGRGRGGRGGRM